MKKFIIILSLTIGITQAQSQKPPGFRIEGHIHGISEKSVVTLSDANKPTDTLARGTVINGVFYFDRSYERAKPGRIEF